MTVPNRRIRPTGPQADSGFTLIEVVVAIALLIMVTIASIYFVSRARFTSSDQQASQIAVTLAGSAMEQLYAVPTTVNTTTGVSNLYTGRNGWDVVRAFAAYPSVAGVSQTYPVWDSTATPSSVTPPTTPSACPSPTVSAVTTPVVTLACTNTVNGTTYTVTTLIGACYRTATYGASAGPQDCQKLSWYYGPQLATPVPYGSSAGVVMLDRAIVIVTWTSPSSCPLAAGCQYSTSTLINTDGDPTWAGS